MTIEELRTKELNEWNGGIPKEKKKKCTTCKKKVVKELEPVVEEVLFPTEQEIKIAYAELTNMKGVEQNKKDYIKNIYKQLFNEELDLDCGGCASQQVRKFTAYLNKNNIKV